MASDSVTYFKNSEEKKIFCKYWYSKLDDGQRIRAAVYVCHGAGEHCLKYERLATIFNGKGLFVFSHDHVGHGQSEGDRMHLTHGSTYINDVVQHVNSVKEKYPDVPFFIVGHSMGGLIALKTALDNPELFTGVVLIGPALVVDPSLSSSFMVCLGKAVATVMPQLQMKAIDPKYLSHDQNIVKQYIEDPLVWHGGLKAKWGLCLLDMINNVRERYSEVKFPLLILQGAEDHICLPSGSQELFDSVSSKNKQLKMYAGAYHQVHNEVDGTAEKSMEDIINWITDFQENNRA